MVSSTDYDLKYQLAIRFKDHLAKTLGKSESWNVDFDQLSKKVKIVQSNDKQLRIFSWDDLTGGTWHALSVLAQFVTAQGEVKVKALSEGDEGMTGAYTDVIISQIHEIEIGGQLHYLTIGRGTHGSGHHHALAQIFIIINNQLKACKQCFATNDHLAVVAPRSSKINLMFHPVEMKLSHNEFTYNDETGLFKPTGKIVEWLLIDGKFRMAP